MFNLCHNLVLKLDIEAMHHMTLLTHQLFVLHSEA